MFDYTNEYYKTAKKVPAIIRAELLNDNVIYKAVAAAGDTHMAILVVVYNNHVFTEGEPIDMRNPCIACLSRILDIFRALEPYFVQQEKECNLIDQLDWE